MPLYDIQGLKKKFVEQSARNERILESFFPFRSAFIELLQEFSNDAEEIGLDNFRPLSKRVDSEGIIEYMISFNGFDLLIVSTDEVYFSDSHSGKLSARIQIYTSDFADSIPFTDITFNEHNGSQFTAHMQWFTTEGPKTITHSRSLDSDSIALQGEEFAELFIGHISRFESSWRERPTLGCLRQRKSSNSTLGFSTE